MNYNPDVLTCLANLSNDEVFTPPAVANAMLDVLPMALWSNPQARFFDPVCKSGVFLREIAKRLFAGLADVLPDAQLRANHIFTQQLYGLALTELTGLLARRTVYCSKTANGRYSLCTAFNDDQGNIRYTPQLHEWVQGKCRYCGASEEVYQRVPELESYAYQFIHTTQPEALFNMQFDVIIGNPPYQMNDGGHGRSASPIYHKFIEQAKKLNPQYVVMIIPARWFAGGKGLDEFRATMLADKRITTLVDYFDSNDCFPQVDISGGVCYFLWDKNANGDCKIVSIRSEAKSEMVRPLLEKNADVFIRFNEAIPIFRKVTAHAEPSFSKIISPRKPFGLVANIKTDRECSEEKIFVFSFPKNGYIKKEIVTLSEQWIDAHKVLVSYAYGERGAFPYLVTGKPFYAPPATCCSETYLVIGPFDGKLQCDHVMSYMRTKFFRFLVLLKKNTQHATGKTYQFVPIQDFTESWTDDKLYQKYGLTADEIAFIESMIRPMEIVNDDTQLAD